jgi:hypothetical protein
VPGVQTCAFPIGGCIAAGLAGLCDCWPARSKLRSGATINSTLFRMRQLSDRHGTKYTRAQHLPHIKLQLALGSMKKHTDPLRDRSQSWTEFMETCPRPDKAWRFLFRANFEYLKRFSVDFPNAAWCLPVALGGAGLPSPPAADACWRRRQPKTLSLVLARLLMEEEYRPADRLRAKWTCALNMMDEPSVQSIMFRDQSRLLEGCKPVLRDLDESKTLLPPNELGYSYCLSGTTDQVQDATQARRAVFFALQRSLKNYLKSGRGPCDVAEVVAFARTKRWCFEGKYSRFRDETVGRISFEPPFFV